MWASRISLASNAAFVCLLLLLHLVRSDVDPSWHFISEYAIGRNGWIMQLAFVCLAVANGTTWLTVRGFLRTAWGRAGSVLFLVGTCGLILAAIFVTDPVNTPVKLQTDSGRLHNLGGALGLLSFVGTLIMSVRLFRSSGSLRAKRAVVIATCTVILGFLISFLGISSLAVQNAGQFSPETPVGWLNRVGILSGCVWLAMIAKWSSLSE